MDKMKEEYEYEEEEGKMIEEYEEAEDKIREEWKR